MTTRRRKSRNGDETRRPADAGTAADGSAEQGRSGYAEPASVPTGPGAGQLLGTLQRERSATATGRLAELSRSLRRTTAATVTVALLLWLGNLSRVPAWSVLAVPALAAATVAATWWTQRRAPRWPQRTAARRMTAVVVATQFPLSLLVLAAIVPA